MTTTHIVSQENLGRGICGHPDYIDLFGSISDDDEKDLCSIFHEKKNIPKQASSSLNSRSSFPTPIPKTQDILKADKLYYDRVKKKYSKTEQLLNDYHPRAVDISSSKVLNAIKDEIEKNIEIPESSKPILTSKISDEAVERIKKTTQPLKNPQPSAAAPVPPLQKKSFFAKFFSDFFSVLKFVTDLLYRHP